MKRALDFDTLRTANVARQAEWDPSNLIDLSYRGNELAGEVGEACNVIKKLERDRLGIPGSRATVADLAEELADALICIDLIAESKGIDLSEAVVRKFNATSSKHGFTTRIEENTPEVQAVEAGGGVSHGEGVAPHGGALNSRPAASPVSTDADADPRRADPDHTEQEGRACADAPAPRLNSQLIAFGKSIASMWSMRSGVPFRQEETSEGRAPRGSLFEHADFGIMQMRYSVARGDGTFAASVELLSDEQRAILLDEFTKAAAE